MPDVILTGDSADRAGDALAHVMQRDRFHLRRLIRQMEQARVRGADFARWEAEYQQLFEESTRMRQRRQRNLPRVQLNRDLPIWEKREEIAAAIQAHPLVVICGETGSGKSTQLPQICLESGRGVAGLIGHTQPRRIAARSVAARLAEELHVSLGTSVGFKVRFTDSTSPETYVKLMTDGILLAETQGDRFLDAYDTLIVDEAHERSLNIDFLLGYLKRLLPKRPDLRVIITSATIDAERFSQHFGQPDAPAPVIQVSGRTYPVEVWYRPPELAAEDDEPDRYEAVLDAIDELFRFDRTGDILVFLATEREILDVAKRLRGRLANDSHCEILPLYARLSIQEQQRVFAPHTGRRIVLATNVAESSLTVPGIRYVVDEGTCRLSRYSPRSKIQRLPIEPISRASADQRRGRCGRLGPGICVRLYSEDDYLARDAFTSPEIRRSNLAAVILRAEALQLGRIDEFPFLDPPTSQLIRDGYTTLFELGAVDEQGELTRLGQRLSQLPVDPRMARMILAAAEGDCLPEVLVIAAALEVQDPRERPVDRQAEADQAHRQFADPDSDFVTYLNLWNFYHGLRSKLSRSQLQKACHQNFLSHLRIREWLDVHRQLLRMLGESHGDWGRRGSHVSRIAQASSEIVSSVAAVPSEAWQRISDRQSRQERETWYGKVHRALLSGLLSSVALRSDKADYQGAQNTKLFAWPGSAISQGKPKWIMAAESVETSRLFARTAARISPDWIEPLANHLVQRTYSDPHWSAKSGSVMAFEKVTLFGLPLSSGRLVPYGPIDPDYCRDVFIREALVAGELRADPPFLRHNRQLRREVEELMARSRRTDLAIDDYAVYRFYAKRLPPDVYDAARLNQWHKRTEQSDPGCLRMSWNDLTAVTDLPPRDQFPDTCVIDQCELPLEYHFEPGSARDGVTLIVPREVLPRLSAARLGWLIPGLVEQQVLAVIKALPKDTRRQLGAAADAARDVTGQLAFAEGVFGEAVGRALTRLAGTRISLDAIPPERLPPFLRMNVRVTDAQGNVLAEGRDLPALREQLGITAQEPTVQDPGGAWSRDGLTRWDFGALPESVVVSRGGVSLPGFPALVDQEQAVGLRLFDSAERARRLMRAGVRRLVVLAESRSLKAHVDWFPELKQIALWATGTCRHQELRDDLAVLIADRAFIGEGPLPRGEPEFNRLLQRGRENVEAAVQEVVRVVGPLFRGYHAVRLALDAPPRPPRTALDDIRTQLDGLLVPHFLITTEWRGLQHFPRYLEAVRVRLQKLATGGAARDQQLIAQISPFQLAYTQRLEEHHKRGIDDLELESFRWMLEEFRVSLFAQALGTALPISAKRLEKQWEKVRRE